MKTFYNDFPLPITQGRKKCKAYLRLLTLLLMCLVTGGAMAQTETSVEFTCNSTNGDFKAATDVEKSKKGTDGAIITAKLSASWSDTNAANLRIKSGNSITFTYTCLEGYEITKIGFCADFDKGTTENSIESTTTDPISIKNGDATLTKSSWSAKEVKITCAVTNSSLRVASMKVYYKSTGTGGNTKKDITLTAIAGNTNLKVGGTTDITVTAKGGSTDVTGLEYSYALDKEGVISVNDGTVTALAAGTATVTVSTTGNDTYNGAKATPITFNVEADSSNPDYSTYDKKDITPIEIERNPGGDVSFVMSSIDGSSQKFQWFVSSTKEYAGTKIDGATSRTYKFKAPDTPGTYYYYCEGHNNKTPGNYISGIGKLTVTEGSTIKFTQAVEPLTETNVGKVVALTVKTDGSNAKYQWYKNTTASNQGGTAISKATSNTFSFTTTTEDVGTYYYYCVVTCTEGTLTSGVAKVVVSNVVAPVLDASRFTVKVGETHNVNVVATANGSNVASELTFTYASDNEAIATVDANGIVTGVKEGTTNIRFTSAAVEGKYEEAEGEVIVTVMAADAFIPVVKYTAAGDATPPATEDQAYTGEYLTITLEPETAITDSYEIWYTEDGSNPTVSSTHQKYDATKPIKLVQTTFLKAAIKVTSGTNKDKWSDILERTFRFNFTLLKTLAKDQQIEPGVGYDITQDGRTYIITTYGSLGDTEGLDKDKTKLWDKGVRDSEMNNSYISGFDYHAIGNKDAGNETITGTATDKNDSKKTINVYAKYDGANADNNTFDIPINGAYMKFEPKVDGQINMIVRQNGMIGGATPNFYQVRKRYAYVCDETGKAMSKADGFTALISTNSVINSETFWFGKNGDDFAKDKDGKAYTEEERALFNQNFKDFRDILWKTVKDNAPEGVTDAAGYWKYCRDRYRKSESTEKEKSYVRNVLSYDEESKGYFLIEKAYVRYSFPVKAGKTYFLMGNWTKLAPCGYSFKRNYKDNTKWDDIVNGRKVTVDGTNKSGVTLTGDKGYVEDTEHHTKTYACNITLNRKFTAGAWTSLVLPFSMSPTEVIDAFGEGTEIIHFNKVEGETLHVTKHFHQMIVAGTPVMIKPANEVTAENGVTLIGTYEPNAAINEMKDEVSGWMITGSYLPATVPAGAYMMANKGTESSMRLISSPMAVAGTRAWLVNTTDPQAKISSISMNGVEDNEATSIEGIFNGVEKTGSNVKGIYNLNGQMVRSNTDDTTGLPSGIYIVNGKKVIVK